MTNEVFQEILKDPYLLSISSIGVLGIFAFLILPFPKKRALENFLPFLLLATVLLYENLGGFLIVNQSINQKIHNWLFDIPFQGWNIWAYNLFYSQISKLIFLLIIGNQIKGRKLKIGVFGLITIFLITCISLQWTGSEPLYYFQPIIYATGNSLIILACCLFFIDLITDPYYLELDPLKMWLFWFITLTLFQGSLVFLAEVSAEYLTFQNRSLFYSLVYISQFLYVIMMFSIAIKFVLERFFNKPLTPVTHA